MSDQQASQTPPAPEVKRTALERLEDLETRTKQVLDYVVSIQNFLQNSQEVTANVLASEERLRRELGIMDQKVNEFTALVQEVSDFTGAIGKSLQKQNLLSPEVFSEAHNDAVSERLIADENSMIESQVMVEAPVVTLESLVSLKLSVNGKVQRARSVIAVKNLSQQEQIKLIGKAPGDKYVSGEKDGVSTEIEVLRILNPNLEGSVGAESQPNA